MSPKMGFEFLPVNYRDSVETEEGGERTGSGEAVEVTVRLPQRFSSWVQLSGFLYFLLPCLVSLFDRLCFLPFEQP